MVSKVCCKLGMVVYCFSIVVMICAGVYILSDHGVTSIALFCVSGIMTAFGIHYIYKKCCNNNNNAFLINGDSDSEVTNYQEIL